MLKQVQHDGFGLAVLLLLAACHHADDAGAEGRRAIDCHIPGQSGFKKVCTVENMDSPEGIVLVARAPDGGFRRFLPVKDERYMIAADGAEEVKVVKHPDSLDVTADDVTWRFPTEERLVAIGAAEGAGAK